jgi:protein-ribulosamine 3-kinase
MTAGEFASMSTLHGVLPKFVPTPLGYGSYESDPDIHFFICKLVNMTDDIPEIQAFCKTLAQLHLKGISPNGKYGFPVHTYKGTIPQYKEWHDTWEESFHHSLKWFVYAEEKSQGPDREMEELCQGIFDKVIPRLLRPLETGGRHLQPRLIHGDIWAGNCSTDVDTNLPIIYDGASLYAHNESMCPKFTRECTIGTQN